MTAFEAGALLAFAAAAFVAALVLVGQTVVRYVSAAAPDLQVLRAVGMRPRQVHAGRRRRPRAGRRGRLGRRRRRGAPRIVAAPRGHGGAGRARARSATLTSSCSAPASCCSRSSWP